MLIVGDGHELENLKNEVNELGITNNVRFVGIRKDIPEILKLIDILVLPSLSEGLPMGLLEAMAAGCSVIASNVGGIPDAVKDYESAILVKPRKVNELQNELLKMLKSNPNKIGYSNKIKSGFPNKYDSRMMARKYENLYLFSKKNITAKLVKSSI